MRRIVSLHGVAAILLLATIAATTYFTVMRFAAELSAQDARYRFERWEAGKAKPKAGEVAVAIAALRAALAYEPGNPNLHSDLGRLLYWDVHAGSLVDAESRGSREAALERFHQVARLRPSSGHTWANIALARYVLGHVGLEFALALDQTLRWAPWQPLLQLSAIQLGLATWQILDEPRQRLVAEAIQRQATWKMVDQKPALIRLLRAYGRMELGCPWAGAALGCPAT
jgi:tetratricopeptide (TPR) repeat protein